MNKNLFSNQLLHPSCSLILKRCGTALLALLAVAALPLYVQALPCPTSVNINNQTCLWYNGDFDTRDGLINEVNGVITNAYVYDNFIVGSGGATFTGAFSNDLTDIHTNLADVEIRTGVGPGNGGTLIFGAYGVPALQNPTGRSGFGLIEYTFWVPVSLTLGPGEYWLMVAPDGNGTGLSYISTTSPSASCVTSYGIGPCAGDDMSYFTSTSFAAYFDPASTWLGYGPADFSMGLTIPTNVPEPFSMKEEMLFGFGLLAAVGVVRRRLPWQLLQ